MLNNVLVEKYLIDNIDISVAMKEKTVDGMPIYLKDAYKYYQSNICHNDCFLCFSKSNRVIINQLIKHMEVLNKLGLVNIIFVFENLRAEQRRRLIDCKIAFIEYNKTIYLPFIFLKLDSIKNTLSINNDLFSPSTQLVFIAIYYNNDTHILPSKLSNQLGITTMSISRALRDLTGKGLLEVSGDNTRKQYYLNDRKQFLNKGKRYLKSPVSKEIWCLKDNKIDEMVYSGDTALSHLSMLNDHAYETYAIDKKLFDKIRLTILDNYQESNAIKVEVYNYDPTLFNDEEDNIDKISLLAQYKDNEDERIQIELEDILEGMK